MPCEAARLAATGTEAPTWGRSTGAETTRTLIMRRFKTLELTLALALIGVVGVGCPVTNPPGPVITVNPGEVGFGGCHHRGRHLQHRHGNADLVGQ
jgi:hypothetical protein